MPSAFEIVLIEDPTSHELIHVHIVFDMCEFHTESHCQIIRPMSMVE